MLRNRWYVVLDAAEVGKKPLGVKRFGERLVFWRDSQGKISCQLDKCCHRGAQLSLGQVLGDCIECPFHGWQFDAQGQCTLVPSNGKNAAVPKKFRVKSYPVQEAFGWIWLYWGDVEEGQELPDIRYFDELLDPRLKYATWQDMWPVHVTRSIENQLDVTHLSFTHKKTIGDAKRPVIDGPIFTWLDDETMHFLSVSQEDKGQIAKKGDQTDPSLAQGSLLFRFPNTWRLKITEKFYNFAAFVPVDDDHSITYIRSYQRLLGIPLLDRWVSKLMILFSKRILGEDRRVVCSQDPIRTELSMDELLVQGDRPIIEFRRRLHELMEAERAGHPAPPIQGKTNGPRGTKLNEPLEHPHINEQIRAEATSHPSHDPQVP